MNNLKKIKLGLYYSFRFLIIMIMISITACNQGSETKGNDSRKSDVVKNTVIKGSTSSGAEQSQPLTNTVNIQKAYSDIVLKANAGTLDSTSFKYSCHGEKNGTVSYFTEKGQLCLIVHRYNEYDHYSAEDRYFVKDSTLFFILAKSVTWAFESGPEGSTKDNIKERRIYLANAEPIKCLEKKFVIRSQIKDNPRSETVPSVEVECPESAAVMKPYLLLTKYRNNPKSGCLE